MKMKNFFSGRALMLAVAAASAIAMSGATYITQLLNMGGTTLIFAPTEKVYGMYDAATGKLAFQVCVDFSTEKAWMYSVSAANVTTDSIVTIPDNIVVEGKAYPIVSMGNTRVKRIGCAKQTALSTLIMGKNIEQIDSIGISDNVNLRKIVLNDKLKALGKYAFRGNTALTEIVLPASLETIEGNPFPGCSAMKKINIDAKNPNFVVENDVMLYNKDKSVLYSYLESAKMPTYKIPDGVKELSAGCFMNWKLKSVDFNDVEVVGEYCMTNSPLDSIVVTPKLRKIENGFNYTNTTYLKKIIVDPANTYFTVYNGILYNKVDGWVVADIKSQADIATLVLPEGVKAVPDYQFYYYKNIKKLKLPSTLEYVGERGFVGCENLEEANFEDTKLGYVNKLAFQSCNLKKVIFPSTMRRTDMQAFYKNEELTEIKLNEGFEFIGYLCFGMSAAEKIVIPSTLNDGQSMPFYRNYSLEKVEVNCRTLPKSIFSGNCCITSVTLNEGLEEIGDEAFAIFLDLSGGAAPSDVSLFSTIKFPSTLKKIGSKAFYNNSIEKINLHKGITYLGPLAFYQSPELESFVAEGLDTMDARAVSWAPYMTEFKLNEGLTYLGAGPAGGSSIRTLNIPSTVKKFGGMLTIVPGKGGPEDTLKNVVCNAIVPPEIFPVDKTAYWSPVDPAIANSSNSIIGVMYNQSPTAPEYTKTWLYVPKESVEAYKANPYWGRFQLIGTIEDFSGVESVDADEAAAPIYYNLQGVRVSQPQPDNIYLKVQGGKAEKIIFK